MKHLIASLLIAFSALVCANAQTNLRTVMVDSNGVVARPTNFIGTNGFVTVTPSNSVVNSPTNFWSANASNINTVISNQGVTFSDMAYSVRQSFFANLATLITNGSFAQTNSEVSFFIAGTNTNAFVGARLIAHVNAEKSQGAGTLFNVDSHTVWIRMENNLGTGSNAITRVVLGNDSYQPSTVGAYPTNIPAIGFEISAVPGTATNRIRLIACNGTNSTNGPWVNVDTIFRKFTVGVQQTKGTNLVRLLYGGSMNTPTNISQINGGPTISGNGNSALDMAVIATGTNPANLSATIYSALVEMAD